MSDKNKRLALHIGLDNINKMIEFVMKALNFDESRFARRIGVSKGGLIRTIGGEDPSYSMIKNLTSMFPVSQEWIWMGKGNPWTMKDISKYINNEEERSSEHREVDEDINSRIKEVRAQSGYSQTIFASELGVTRDVITSIENMRTAPTIHMIKLIADKFEVNPLWLIYGTGRMLKR